VDALGVAAARIKGAAFREFIAWLGETEGQSELVRVPVQTAP
jgi:hypothetical protein